MNDDVTVIVTCFDYGAYLPESVESALAQEGGAPRVIVVDDGSTDARTLAALDRLPPQVTLVRQSNAGPAEARNAGLRRLQTPYALILDADDRLAADALRRLRAPLRSQPTLGFSYGIMRFFGAWEGVVRLPPYDPYRLLYRHNIGLTALIRRGLLEDVGGFDPALAGYEDWEFWLHALACGWRGTRVEAVTLLHRRHGSSRNIGARADYRAIYRQLRRKHATLYRREQRRRLRAESDLGGLGRLAYRWWWGRRPLPARVELALQSALWRPRLRPDGSETRSGSSAAMSADSSSSPPSE
ncbi:MAG TPA: glycosyltransferase family 2 protein [Solirubrobacteraceae bacterium]|jgi:glycosyltransferase involved in cell wall biosynthesis|nr:glycosyltransferase family 2 protein [Solirubrobacteraceae bacterium]